MRKNWIGLHLINIFFCCFFMIVNAEMQPLLQGTDDVSGGDQEDQPQVSQDITPTPPTTSSLVAPLPAQEVLLPPESIQPPAEAVMMVEDVSGQPSTSLIITDLFKKASINIEQIVPIGLAIDKKRQNIYTTFFEIDKMLDKVYPEMLEKIGKLEETFTPKNIVAQ